MTIGHPKVNIGTLRGMGKRGLRDRTAFGRRMLDARRAAGLTQEAVAKALGISQGNLSEIESDFESSGYTAQLAALYGVDAHYLATGEHARTANGSGETTPPHLRPLVRRILALSTEQQEEALAACIQAVVIVKAGMPVSVLAVERPEPLPSPSHPPGTGRPAKAPPASPVRKRTSSK